MVLHQAFRASRARSNSIGGEVRHGGVTSGASRETSLSKHVTPHLGSDAHGRAGSGLAAADDVRVVKLQEEGDLPHRGDGEAVVGPPRRISQ